MQSQKPTIKIRGASSYNRKRKLSKLAGVISGISSYPTILYPRAKAASSIEVDKYQKLHELSRLIKGF